jgi:signal transduction histidine kinase
VTRSQAVPLPSIAAGLATVAVGLGAASGYIEITDAEPRAQLWMGGAAGAVFLLAIAFVRGGQAQVLATRARLLIGAGASAVLAVIGLWQATERNEPRVLLLLVPAMLFFITAILAVREAGRTSQAVRAGQLRSRLDGEEAERRRWAQELHDQTLQDLAAIEVRLSGLTSSRDPEALAAGLQDARVMVREQIRTLRHLITQMRPLALDTLGLAAALQDLAQRAEAAGDVLVQCEVDELPDRIRPDVEMSIYRVVQEAVSNALRHAACHRIDLAARTVGPLLQVTVRDDGIGLESAAPDRGGGSTGFGMVGMTERAESMGGRVGWSTPAGGGTLITLQVPVERVSRLRPPN